MTNIYKLRLNNNLLTDIIPDIICELKLRWYREVILDIFGQPVSSVWDNRICPLYPSCLNVNYYVNGLRPYPMAGNQNTSDCNWASYNLRNVFCDWMLYLIALLSIALVDCLGNLLPNAGKSGIGSIHFIPLKVFEQKVCLPSVQWWVVLYSQFIKKKNKITNL